MTVTFISGERREILDGWLRKHGVEPSTISDALHDDQANNNLTLFARDLEQMLRLVGEADLDELIESLT